jgi:Tfp pilus assembly protein PilV
MKSRRYEQRGITLLEVLVGFVIFTASLVAVLDYVGGQVYLYRLSDSQIQRVQLIYDLTAEPRLEQGNYRSSQSGASALRWEVEASQIDVLERRQGNLQLQQWEYLVAGGNGASFNWSVIRLQ